MKPEWMVVCVGMAMGVSGDEPTIHAVIDPSTKTWPFCPPLDSSTDQFKLFHKFLLMGAGLVRTLTITVRKLKIDESWRKKQFATIVHSHLRDTLPIPTNSSKLCLRFWIRITFSRSLFYIQTLRSTPYAIFLILHSAASNSGGISPAYSCSSNKLFLAVAKVNISCT
jgi:hypothetical protein